MSCGFNRQDSACGLFGSTPCFESGFVPVPLPINRPQYMYETNCSTTTYYGGGKPCCSAPSCGTGNCGARTVGGCNKDNKREGFGDMKVIDMESSPEYRQSVGYGRINQPSMCCGKGSKDVQPCCHKEKCGLDCRNRGGYGLSSSNPGCNFCSYY